MGEVSFPSKHVSCSLSVHAVTSPAWKETAALAASQSQKGFPDFVGFDTRSDQTQLPGEEK